MDSGEPVPEPEFDFYLPDELEQGVYANTLTVWHTAHEFTLDFAALQRPVVKDAEVVALCRVVTRVKLPATVIFDVIRELNLDMTQFEQEYGEIRRPGSPEAEA